MVRCFAMSRVPSYAGPVLALLLGIGAGLGVGWIKGRTPVQSLVPLEISGMIDIRPELKKRLKPTDTLFIIVTQPGSRIPLAVKKVAPVRLPYIYRIGPENLMIPGRTLEGPVSLKVRLDKDGQANPDQPGDLTGKPAQDPLELPARGVHVLIDTVVSHGDSG